MAKKKTDDAAVRFDPDNYVKIEYDKTAPSVRATIIQNGEVVQPDDPVTQGELAIILNDYVNTDDLATALNPYLPKADASSTYVTKTDAVATYVTKNELTAVLAEYATKSELNTAFAAIPIIDSGISVSAGDVNAGSYKDIEVAFNKEFNTIDNTIVLSLSTSSTAAGMGNLSIAVAGRTRTGFTARIYNNDNTKRVPSFNWIAIGR